MSWVKKRTWLYIFLLLLSTAGLFSYKFIQSTTPSAGAVYQDAPDRVIAGTKARISLRLAVWGPGGPASARYRNIQLLIKSSGDEQWTALRPVRIVDASDGITCLFEFGAPKKSTSALSYRFTFVFDGQQKEVLGKKTIAVVEKQ